MKLHSEKNQELFELTITFAVSRTTPKLEPGDVIRHDEKYHVLPETMRIEDNEPVLTVLPCVLRSESVAIKTLDCATVNEPIIDKAVHDSV